MTLRSCVYRNLPITEEERNNSCFCVVLLSAAARLSALLCAVEAELPQIVFLSVFVKTIVKVIH